MRLSKIYGIHSVQAALDYSAKNIHFAWIDSGRQDKKLSEILQELLALGIKPEKADRKRLDRLADSKNHQGIVLEVELPSALAEEQLYTAVANLTDPAFFFDIR